MNTEIYTPREWTLLYTWTGDEDIPRGTIRVGEVARAVNDHTLHVAGDGAEYEAVRHESAEFLLAVHPSAKRTAPVDAEQPEEGRQERFQQSDIVWGRTPVKPEYVEYRSAA